ncbi:MAG: TraR/DksA family transcriptional regulator [Desulfobulbus sp.]|nr:TraR/DksA family transcriptional regulator [Desulfobulbus sp.]
MDEVDVAQELQDAHLRRLLAARVYALPRGEAARQCVTCGGPIPEERRQAMPGCQNCVSCQTAAERAIKEAR